MTFRAIFRCANGHKDMILYGETFTREMANDHCAMIFGGFHHALQRKIDGVQLGCSLPDCSARVSWEIAEGPPA